MHALGLGRAVPSEPTLRRVIEALDAELFSLICGAWLRLRVHTIGGRLVIALDGKTVRGARAGDAAAPHLVSAFTHTTGVTLAQTQVDGTGEPCKLVRELGQVVVAGDGGDHINAGAAYPSWHPHRIHGGRQGLLPDLVSENGDEAAALLEPCPE